VQKKENPLKYGGFKGFLVVSETIWNRFVVETAGIEPASANPPFMVLHA